jgi:predicted RNase H-like nuclease (RuvC/YqgF family)
MYIRNIAILVVTSIMLGACNTLPVGSNSWSPGLSVRQVDNLLAYYAVVRAQSVTELDVEYEKAKQQLVQHGTNPYRMRLALLLMLPNSHFHSDAAAIALLNEVLKETYAEPTSLQNFASFLLIKLNEQQRAVDEQMQRVRNEQKRNEELAQKLKDEQKRSDELVQKLKDEQKYSDDLQIKVDAIKSMEKNMMHRDKHLWAR